VDDLTPDCVDLIADFVGQSIDERCYPNLDVAMCLSNRCLMSMKLGDMGPALEDAKAACALEPAYMRAVERVAQSMRAANQQVENLGLDLSGIKDLSHVLAGEDWRNNLEESWA
jgi:hypothetical protein